MFFSNWLTSSIVHVQRGRASFADEGSQMSTPARLQCRFHAVVDEVTQSAMGDGSRWIDCMLVPQWEQVEFNQILRCLDERLPEFDAVALGVGDPGEVAV
jgi:hypothetical protein